MPEEIIPQPTKAQHYVPQFYLRKFVNTENKLEIIDCERRKTVTARAPKSVCNEDYFYSVDGSLDEVSQSMEQEFNRLETAISEEYDKLAEKFLTNQEISVEDKLTLSTFMSMQYLRGPYMRKQVQNMNSKMIKTMVEFSVEGEDIKKVSKVLEKNPDLHIETNNAAHLRLIGEMKGFRNLLYAKEWKVYISKSKKKFITSDNPLIELFPSWTGKFAYGASFLIRTHIFSMTPDIHLVMTYPRDDRGNKIKRKTFFDNPEHNDKILELNFDHVRFANEYAYASDKVFLQDIIDSANLYDKQQTLKLGKLMQQFRKI